MRVARIGHDGQFVADGDVSEDLTLLHRPDDIVAHGASSLVAEHYDDGVGTTVASQSIDRMVTLQPHFVRDGTLVAIGRHVGAGCQESYHNEKQWIEYSLHIFKYFYDTKLAKNC